MVDRKYILEGFIRMSFAVEEEEEEKFPPSNYKFRGKYLFLSDQELQDWWKARRTGSDDSFAVF